jgi:hypothetical protein
LSVVFGGGSIILLLSIIGDVASVVRLANALDEESPWKPIASALHAVDLNRSYVGAEAMLLSTVEGLPFRILVLGMSCATFWSLEKTRRLHSSDDQSSREP